MSTHTNVNKQSLSCNGKTYVLRTPYRVIDTFKGISEGPFYDVAGAVESRFAYMPDLAFLLGHTADPWVMHRIQLQ